MRSRPLMTLRLTTAPTQNVGAGPRGTRVTFPITGGSFEGDRLRGKVLPGGGDWVVKRPDGKYWNVPITSYPNVSQFWTYDPKEFLKNPVYSRDWPPAKNLEP